MSYIYIYVYQFTKKGRFYQYFIFLLSYACKHVVTLLFSVLQRHIFSIFENYVLVWINWSLFELIKRDKQDFLYTCTGKHVTITLKRKCFFKISWSLFKSLSSVCSLVTLSLISYFFRKVTLFQLVTFTKSNVTHIEMHIKKVWCKILLSACKERTFLKIFMTNSCSHSKILIIKD